MSASRLDGLLQHAVGLLDRGAFRQVDDDLQLGLVVEGQELDRHVLGVEQASEPRVSDADEGQEGPGAPRGGKDRPGDRHVGAAEGADHVVPWPGAAGPSAGPTRIISHGVSITATKNENSIAAEALAGIGLI